MCPKTFAEERHKHPLLRNCLALVLRRKDGKVTETWPEDEDWSLEPHASGVVNGACCDGDLIFKDFVNQNVQCFWNSCLVESVTSLQYKGCLVPSTLLVTSSDFSLEVVRSAWARRVLRPPRGYDIRRLGELALVEMTVVPQTQFAPLTEALCKVICELNAEGVLATNDVISSRLEISFPEMVVPSNDILYRTLGNLIRERKLYHTGKGYFVVSPDTYRMTASSPPSERQMLMTNEEAIVRLHGNDTTGTSSPRDGQRQRTFGIQTDENDIASAWRCLENIRVVSSHVHQLEESKLERSHSLRLSRGKGQQDGRDRLNRCNSLRETAGGSNGTIIVADSDKEVDQQEPQKRERMSMLSKLFRRVHFLAEKTTTKHVTFSAQFPPIEWSDPSYVHFHSIGTQTTERDAILRIKTRQRSHCHERHSLQVHASHSDGLLKECIPDSSLAFMSKSDNLLRRTLHYTENNTIHRRSMPISRKALPRVVSPPGRPTRQNYPSSNRRKYRRSSSENPTIGRINNRETFKSKDKHKNINIANDFLQTSFPAVTTTSPKAIISPCPSFSKNKDPGGSPVRMKNSTSPLANLSSNTSTEGILNTSSPKEYKKIIKTPQQSPSVSRSGTPKKEKTVRPLTPEKLSSENMNIHVTNERKITPTKDVIIDNSVNFEISVKSPVLKRQENAKTNNIPKITTIGTTVNQKVTKHSTFGKDIGLPKFTTVTSISTSLSHGALKDLTKVPTTPELKCKSSGNSPIHGTKEALSNILKNCDLKT